MKGTSKIALAISLLLAVLQPGEAIAATTILDSMNICVSANGQITMIAPDTSCEPNQKMYTILLKGDQGPQGDKGDKGDPGEAGATGAAGPAGPQGDKGDKGDPGEAGAAGASGPAGPQGDKGDKGDPGEAGAAGAAGPVGPQGDKGDKGDPGEAGATGASGPAGPQGPAGPAGAQGPAGIQGIYGDASAGDLSISVGQTVDLTGTNADTLLPAGFNMQYSNISISGTLIVPSGTLLRATGNITIDGMLQVNPSAMDTSTLTSYSAANPGVARGPAAIPMGGVAVTKLQAGQLTQALTVGGGAGARANATTALTGGEGGGSVVLVAGGDISISGNIYANGADSTNLHSVGQGIPGGGGGGGGIIVAATKGSITITSTGRLSANGGAGSSGFDGNLGNSEGGGGGGGGGIIHLIASGTTDNPNISIANAGNLRVYGGSAGYQDGYSGNITNGRGGGASGGNGGNGGSMDSPAQGGSAGFIIKTAANSPEYLLRR